MRFFLIHGSDDGLVRERARAIVRSRAAAESDMLAVTRLDGDEIARQPSRLLDEAYASSLFGGTRSIWIDAQSRDLRRILELLFKNPPEACTVVIRAGILKKDAGLRDLFEKARNAASIECHSDSAETLRLLVEHEVQSFGVSVSPAAKEMIVNLFGADRQTTRHGLAKLLLYAAGQSEISLKDVSTALGNDSLPRIDGLIDQALETPRSTIAAAAGLYLSAGFEGELLISRLTARLLSLYRLRLDMDAKHNGQGSPGLENPGWSSNSASQRLSLLRASSARIRVYPTLAPQFLVRALWALASRARRAQR